MKHWKVEICWNICQTQNTGNQIMTSRNLKKTEQQRHFRSDLLRPSLRAQYQLTARRAATLEKFSLNSVQIIISQATGKARKWFWLWQPLVVTIIFISNALLGTWEWWSPVWAQDKSPRQPHGHQACPALPAEGPGMKCCSYFFQKLKLISKNTW